jgi:hypothetical protein
MAVSRSSCSLSGASHPEPLHPVRRASEFDINYPPRYSTLGAQAPSNNGPTQAPPGPPAYSSVFQRPQSFESVDARPHIRPLSPACHPGARNGVHSHHSYHIIGSKTEPWATLKVYSPSSSQLHRQNTLCFTTGDSIRGSLELNLDTPQNISSVSLSVSKNKTALFYLHPSSLVARPDYM